MRCAWQAYLNLLPVWMRQSVDKYGRDNLQELRLRLNIPPELITSKETIRLERCVGTEDLHYCVNAASRYSPWTASTSAQGYITAQGGHRIGLCGNAVATNGIMSGIQTITSLCLRVARDYPGIAGKATSSYGSVLIIGRPGSGKTTLLRDLIRNKSDMSNETVAVVDERGEVFPQFCGKFAFPIGQHTDVLSGCKKSQGVEAVLRNMSPDIIAVDEITAQEDCLALLHAGWCGVKLLATAHAGCKEDLLSRPVYRPIIETSLFDTLLILRPDKSWYMEEMK